MNAGKHKQREEVHTNNITWLQKTTAPDQKPSLNHSSLCKAHRQDPSAS